MGRGLRVCFVALLLLVPVWLPADVHPFRTPLWGADPDRKTLQVLAVADPVGRADQPHSVSRIQATARLRAASRIRTAIARLCSTQSEEPAQSNDAVQSEDPDLMEGDNAELVDAESYARVAVPYCALLRRLPDPEGLDYWMRQLNAANLSAVQVVDQMIASAEYQARQVRSYRMTLANLALAPEREEERLARLAAEEAVLAEQARLDGLAAAVRQNQAIEQAESAKRAARLRVRNEISTTDFDSWVEQRAAGDLDRVTPALVHVRQEGNGQRINVAYVHLSATRGVAVSPGDRGRATVGSYAAEIGAHVAINGNWYAPYDGPAVSGGVVYGGEDHGYTALFGFTADGDAIIDHHREIPGYVDDRVVEGVSGHPTLVFRGETTTDFGGDPTFTARNPRTAIGLDETGDILIMVTVDGRSSTARGMTGAQTAELMSALGALDAVMLDGGGSTTMWIADRGVVNRPSGSLRSVGNQIAAFGN